MQVKTVTLQLGGLDAEPEQDTPLFRSRIAQFERRADEIKACLLFSHHTGRR